MIPILDCTYILPIPVSDFNTGTKAHIMIRKRVFLFYINPKD